jgi:hypothetical protein
MRVASPSLIIWLSTSSSATTSGMVPLCVPLYVPLCVPLVTSHPLKNVV